MMAASNAVPNRKIIRIYIPSLIDHCFPWSPTEDVLFLLAKALVFSLVRNCARDWDTVKWDHVVSQAKKSLGDTPIVLLYVDIALCMDDRIQDLKHLIVKACLETMQTPKGLVVIPVVTSKVSQSDTAIASVVHGIHLG